MIRSCTRTGRDHALASIARVFERTEQTRSFTRRELGARQDRRRVLAAAWERRRWLLHFEEEEIQNEDGIGEVGLQVAVGVRGSRAGLSPTKR